MRGERYLTKSKQYARVYDRGNSWADSLLVIKALPNGLTLSKYGISVSKRVGKAVVRNRVKRLLREILRVTQLKQGWDIVLVARPAAGKADYISLKESIDGLLSRARLLMKEDDKVRLGID